MKGGSSTDPNFLHDLPGNFQRDRPASAGQPTPGSARMNGRLDAFSYDDAIVRKFLFATAIWGLVGMTVGLLIALQLAFPALNFGLPFTSFGRLRPLHT